MSCIRLSCEYLNFLLAHFIHPTVSRCTLCYNLSFQTLEMFEQNLIILGFVELNMLFYFWLHLV